MKNEKGQLSNYVTFPKEIREDYYLESKITVTDIIVLLWLFLLTNPTNGYAIISYKGLEDELKGFITQAYLRKAFSKLKKLELIWFKDNRGSSKPMKVYVDGYLRSSKVINSVKKINNTTPTQGGVSQLSPVIHNLDSSKIYMGKDENTSSSDMVFTTAHTDTNTYKDNDNYTDNQFNNRLNKSNPSSGATHIGEIINPRKSMIDGWNKSGSGVNPPAD